MTGERSGPKAPRTVSGVALVALFVSAIAVALLAVAWRLRSDTPHPLPLAPAPTVDAR